MTSFTSLTSAVLVRAWRQQTRPFRRHSASVQMPARHTLRGDNIADSYAALRRYAEQKSTLDRMLAIEPNDVEAKAWRASVELNWKADTRPFHQLIDEIRAANPAAIPKIVPFWLTCALAERDPAAAKDALLASDEISLGTDAVLFTRPFVEGVIARMTNDE